MGHVRDLPKSTLGVDVQHDFNPQYVVPRDKSKTVKDLRQRVQSARAVYLATDPDREGEAIAWHVREVTGAGSNNQPVYRVEFHEITPGAIQDAVANPRTIDMHLVDAQQARRVVDREREIEAFVPVEYWTIEADLSKRPSGKKKDQFHAALALVGGKKADLKNEAEA